MLEVPVLKSVIDRRILVNYRVAPDVLAAFLPPPFTPKLLGGVGIAGACLIRLQEIRLPYLPAALGVEDEEATALFEW